MKLMLVSDFAQIRRGMLNTLLVCVFVAGVMSYSLGSPVAGAAVVASTFPYITVYSVLANDEAAGWARLRQTMPLTRRDVVFGRYAGTLVVIAVGCVLAVALALAFGALFGMLGVAGELPGAQAEDLLSGVVFASIAGSVVDVVMLAIILPVVMLLGLSRTARILPLVFVFALCGFFGSMSEGALDALYASASLPLFGLGVALGALALFAASAFLNLKFYQAREF